MTKKHLIILLLGVASVNCYALNFNIKEELNALDKVLDARQGIDAQKRRKIDSLTRAAALSYHPYTEYYDLYREYRSYNYDTALVYVDFMQREALPAQRAEVDLCRAFVYLSGGLFKEASDILSPWLQQYEPTADTNLLRHYYILHARLLWDMADNAGGQIGDRYNNEGIAKCARLQDFLLPADTALRWYSLAVMDLREGNYTRSVERCLASLNAPQVSVHDRAITTSTLAYLYLRTGDIENALHYYIEAAICDVRSSTYETVAMRNIAELLFEKGETDLADRYIHLAMMDAQRYHARHRQVSIAQSLPIIEQKMLSRIRKQQNITLALLVFVAVLLLIGVAGIVLLIRKNKALSSARETIDRMNISLSEANKLKEHLLGTLLSSRSKFINAVQRYQQDVKQHAVNRQWSELMTIPKDSDARMQRVVLEHQIDTIILSIFPTFVEDFNALLRPEENLTLKKDELLNAQLRIFAFIRLGITHNEVIADILDYSINTVYSYKTRVINASSLSQDEFYKALYRIGSV